ncbi:MAG: helix-turn-helix domain-containing protein [Patescibacteria group bacterium]
MITDVLKKLGLDKKESELFVTLLQLGPTRASTLAYRVHLPRTTTQNILTRLEKEGFVTKSIEKNVFLFAAVHPDNLPQMMEMKKREAVSNYNLFIEEAKRMAPQLIRMMKSGKNLPNVRFYQGREAARTVLFDTLTSKTELKDIVNIDAMFEHMQDINDEYVAEREKTKVTKRSLLLDTPFARKTYEGGGYSPKSHKGYKWISSALYPFALEMNIYDGKVSYITYVENDFVGVIIENEHIYRMHDSMWNLIWDLLPAPKKA